MARAAGLVALSLLSLLAACDSRPAAPSPGAAGRLNIYNWANYIGPDTVPEFERRTGIRVVYDTYDSEETLEAKLLAGDSGYDVISTSPDTFAPGIAAGEFEPLDRSLLPHWHNLDNRTLAMLAEFDPGNRYAVPYLHAISGYAYNIDMVKARMADAPLDSLDLLFKPEVVSRFADCGVTFLDSPADVLPLALLYLHRDPNSTSAQDYADAEAVVSHVVASLRSFQSVGYIQDLANRELCVVMSWSSDYSVAMAHARAAGIDLHLAFTIPREGANIVDDALLIPADAPHREAAHRFLNYMLEPQVIAAVTNAIHYGNNNRAADAYVDPHILNDPVLYPPRQVLDRLYHLRPPTPELRRLRTRSWTRIKTGH
jgi:putrescine transport system substrate-binding protein